jgi:hypothetical protein
MSRRHHGGRPHRPNGHARNPNPAAHGPARPSAPPPPRPIDGSPPEALAGTAAAPEAPRPDAAAVEAHLPTAPLTQPAPTASERVAPAVAFSGPRPTRPIEPRIGGPNGEVQNGSAGCTAPQLRRFIKSRPYVPMHELRRRFGINGHDDEVTAVDVAGSRVFVGLPAREGGLLGELLRGGEVGYELSLDPRSPIVVGLYPMRPVPRS